MHWLHWSIFLFTPWKENHIKRRKRKTLCHLHVDSLNSITFEVMVFVSLLIDFIFSLVEKHHHGNWPLLEKFTFLLLLRLFASIKGRSHKFFEGVWGGWFKFFVYGLKFFPQNHSKLKTFLVEKRRKVTKKTPPCYSSASIFFL